MRSTISRDSRGVYRRDLGYKKSGDTYIQPRFYLGREQATATLRALQLEEVWLAVEKRWQRNHDTERPLWDEDTMAIAQAIAKGERHVFFDHVGDDGTNLQHAGMHWLILMRQDFPMVEINFRDASFQNHGQARLVQAAQDNERMLQFLKQQDTSQKLHEALAAYSTHLSSKYLTLDTPPQLSPTGQNYTNQVARLKEHHEDIPLSAFDIRAIDNMLEYWRTRPLTKRNARSTPNTCRQMIQRVRHFVRWLHKSPQFEWRKPEDLEFTAVRIPITHQELSSKLTPNQVETYTTPELTTLYQHATPHFRLLMLLALNCDFGQAEISTLLLNEIHLDTTHPKYKTADSFIKRIRFKSRVYGEWVLWEETAKAIRWQLTQRPSTTRNELLLTGKGKPLNALTEKGKRTSRIAVLWDKLVGQIQKEHPDFRHLSFNKLRKTGADMMRDIAGGEVASVYQCHGSPVREDQLQDVYTNRPFQKVFAGLAIMHERLKPMFASVAEPFPPGPARRKSILPLRTINRIKELARQGFKHTHIARELNVTTETVRTYAKDV